jgi:hypothetical protein
MFCPRCGQPQPNEATRFCPRCGCEVGALKAFVEGSAPAPGASAAAARPPNAADAVRSKRDVTKGALWMFVFAFVVAALTVEFPPAHSGRIFFLTIAWLLLTLLINIGPLVRYFFGGEAAPSSVAEEKPPALDRVRRLFGRERPRASLPASRGEPVGIPVARPADTGEIIEAPASVSEHTTNLLDRQR